MKKLILIFTILFLPSLNAQPSELIVLFSGADNVYAVDLDGSTEYMSKTSPINLDLNGANTITTLARNSTFEDNATDWATNGTHVVSVDGTSKLTGTYTGKIAASGVGDSTTNFASLATDKYTTIVSGTKYTLQIQVRAVLADTDVILVIGGKAKSFTAVDQTSEILIYNFEATSAEVGQKIIIYLSQADDVFIDQVDLSVAYDLTINVWTKLNASSAIEGLLYYRASHWYSLYIAANSRVVANIYDGASEKSRSTDAVVDDAVWYLFTATYDRTGNLSLYQDGVLQGSGLDISGLGAVRPATTLRIGSNHAGSNTINGLIGETQIIRGQVLTSAQVLTAFKRGQAGKHFLETGNEVAWYKLKGNNNTDFLSDETGNNDLTGTNVTQSDDQVKLTKYLTAGLGFLLLILIGLRIKKTQGLENK